MGWTREKRTWRTSLRTYIGPSKAVQSVQFGVKIIIIRRIRIKVIEPILANRLIPLEKGNGEVQPTDVGEVSRRIIARYVRKVTKQDIIDAYGSLQVFGGLTSGSEATIHTMHRIFEADDTDAVPLIDALTDIYGGHYTG